MSVAVITMADRRREEAYLLACRLQSDLNLLTRNLSEIAAASREEALMQRDPSHIADNLAACTSALMGYDVRRLMDLIREGF